MKSLIKALSITVAMLAFLFIFLAGATFCMHIIFQKENMTQIVDQYMATAGAENSALQNGQTASSASSEQDSANEAGELSSIYDILDSGDIVELDAILSSPDFLSIMSYYGSISDITALSDQGQADIALLDGGFFEMFSSVGTIFKIVKGDYGLVSLLLNFVDSKDLLSTEVLDKALEDEKVAKHYSNPENSGELKNAFLRTKLASRMTLEAAYVYFDYFNSAKSAENWQKKLHSSLTAIEDKREQDFSVLIGHSITESDRQLIDALKNALASTMVSEMTLPEDKANSLSGGMQLLLHVFFSNGVVIALLVFALVLVTLIFIIQHEFGKGSIYLGFVLVISGTLLALMRFLNNYIIGPFYNDEGSEFKAMMTFVIAGVSIAVAGLIILILPAVICKIRDHKAIKASNVDAVPSFVTVNAISQVGLWDIIVEKGQNPHRRSDGLVDYYGDGRGLEAQREFQKRKGGNLQPNNDYGSPANGSDKIGDPNSHCYPPDNKNN